jgi:type IV pilus assembly protein PilC
LPLIGPVIQNYNLANITRNLGLLLKSGVPIAETLNITTKITSNLVYKAELGKISHTTNRGQKISFYFSNNKELFPDILVQVVSVGEQSGHLSDSLIYLSELYESEVENFTKNLTNTIEPILMIIMGAIVGLIAVSIITPIYSITQNLTPK